MIGTNMSKIIIYFLNNYLGILQNIDMIRRKDEKIYI